MDQKNAHEPNPLLDADGFEVFEERGDSFDPMLAKKLHDHIYFPGYGSDPEEAYKAFRGHAARHGELLRKRGLADTPRGKA